MFRRKKDDLDLEDFWDDLDEEAAIQSATSRRLMWIAALVILLLGVLILFTLRIRTARLNESVASFAPASSTTDAFALVATTAVPQPSATSSATLLPTQTGVPVPTAQPELPSTYNPEVLAQQMLALINQARTFEGLTAVAWDDTAAMAGQAHAEDMLRFNYFSHWNREGFGPDHRYSQMGGTHAVRENLHAFSHTYENGQGVPIANWTERIQDAHTGLMNSPGHRANILDPAHTHVGIGMAYDPPTGQFRLAQEFTNQYAQLDSPLHQQLGVNDSISISGQFAGAELSNPLLQLAYEPFPPSLTLDELAQTDTYSSTAVAVETRRIELRFAEVILLNQAQPGLYHVRLFVDIRGQQALVFDHVITVR